MYTASTVSKGGGIKIPVCVEGTQFSMQLDTAADMSLVPESFYAKHLKHLPLQAAGIVLKTFDNQKVELAGKILVDVKYEDQQVRHLPLFITKGADKAALFGLQWLDKIKLDWNKVCSLTASLSALLGRHKDVFGEELGLLKGEAAKIYVDDSQIPKFFKPRSVPCAMKQMVEEELDRLTTMKVIEPVCFAEWATPIVPVLKTAGSISICGDYKITVNRVSHLEQYPIPSLDDLCEKLTGGKQFSKLDLSHANPQLPLDEASKQFVTINTHKGLFRYNRLPFGVRTAPAIFQRTIENILQGIPHMAVYLDDIIVTGTTRAQHLETLNIFLSRLAEAGLKLKREKCTFMADEVLYLGHRIDQHGLHPVRDKVEAIQKAREPDNVPELQPFLGLLNYYGRFLPKLSTVLAPLHKLLCKDTKWYWGPQQQQSFLQVKELLLPVNVLVHYDPSKPIPLQSDASNYGLGAVLSHIMDDGSERPVSFASRTLNAAEKNYSQLDKEAAAIMFALKKFHKQLYDRRFVIITDHQLLVSLFSDLKQVPITASARIQRNAITLGGYEYEIKYRTG